MLEFQKPGKARFAGFFCANKIMKHRFRLFYNWRARKKSMESNMIQVGENIPAVSITVIKDGEQKTVAANEYFSARRTVLFAVPGAFTPTCSEAHLPGFVVKYDEVLSKGIDEIICLSVNDSFVMKSWQSAQNAENITMLADGGATFTRSLGLELDTADFGGIRSRRYSMVINNGAVEILNAEEKTGFDVSDVDTLLSQL